MQTFATFVLHDIKDSKMKVLVTGANGLLGHQVVFELLRRNHQVSIIVRSERNIFFDPNAVEVHTGNFTDYHQLKIASQGCSAIINIAAVTATDLPHYEDYHKINAVGAGLIVKVSEELKIDKLVFVSTANTVGYGSPNQLADETYPIQPPFSNSYYAQSKVEAEKIFSNAANKNGKHVLIVNPSFMIGDYDTKPSSGKLMLMGFRKTVLFIPGGGKNFVPVKDVARVVCNALTQGRSGERYLATGENMSFLEYYNLQSKIANYKQFIIIIPDFFLKIVGITGDILRKIGLKTEICSMNINQLLIREYYSNAKSQRDLRLSPTSLEKAIPEALEWFKKHPTS